MKLVTALLTIALAFGVSHSLGSRATGASINNIPGVPISAGSVAAKIGGATYDHVYSLNVEAGTVLLVTLRGESGSELGLYLFDSDAKSVYESEPFASSARAGGDQTVSTQFFRESTVYINVNGRNVDREYSYQLNVSAVVDRTPPVIRIANARAYSRPSAACAQVDAADGISGVQSIAILQGFDSALADWMPYTGPKYYCTALESEDGPQSLVVASRNNIGLISYRDAGTTLFDSVTPSLIRTEPRGQVTYASRPKIAWEFSEPITTIIKGASRVLALSQAGEPIDGRVWFSSDATTLYWEPLDAIRIGTLFSAIPSSVKDRAGNVLSMIEPIVIARKVKTQLDLKIVRIGAERVALYLMSSKRLVGEKVALSQRVAGAWIRLPDVTITGTTMRVKIPRYGVTRIKVVWAGSDRLGESQAVISIPLLGR